MKVNPVLFGGATALLILALSSKKKGQKLFGTFNISSLSTEEKSILHTHFAIPQGKEIPPSYITNEIARYSLLPVELRSPEQNKILGILEKCVT